MDEAVGVLEVRFGERMHAHEGSSAFRENYEKIVEAAEEKSVPPQARLDEVKKLAKIEKLDHFKKEQDFPTTELSLTPETEGDTLREVVLTKDKIWTLSLLSLQLKIVRNAQVVIERYLAVDVFGDEQVKKAQELTTKIGGFLK